MTDPTIGPFGGRRTGPRIVRAKVGVPPLRLDTVPRARLLDLLDASSAKCVLVSAPAGSGKTVLLVEWIRRSAVPAAWLSLDPLDNDPARFCVHLAAALRASGEASFEAAAVAVGRTGRVDLRSSDGVPLLAGASPEGVLVLDDVHVLDASPTRTLLESLVEAADSGPRIVLLTRVDPPLPLARMRVSGDLFELRQRELRFDHSEIAELLRRSVGVEPHPNSIGRLEHHTEGWAAGVRMAAIAIGRSPEAEAAIDALTGSHEFVVDYLMEEVVSMQDPALQQFLLDTSILPRFTEDACIAVTGDPRCAEHLKAAEEANLFVIPLDDHRRWYRYHHLFSDLLQFRLEATAPERLQELLARASRWFESSGEVQTALGLAARMRDEGLLLDLLDRHGYEILARSEFASFAHWLQHVTDPLSRPYPMFLVALGWFHAQTMRSPDLGGLLDAIESAIQQAPPEYPDCRLAEARAHLGALHAFALRVGDRYDESISMAQQVLAALPPGGSVVRGVVEFNLGAVYLRLADTAAARAHLERAYDESLRNGVPYLVLASLGHLGALAAQADGVPAARMQLEGAIAFAEAEALADLPAFGIVLYQLAAVHELANELDAAAALLERAVTLTRGERETDIQANVLIHQTRLETARGDLDAAEARLAAAEGLAYGHHVNLFGTTLAVERARLTAASGGERFDPDRVDLSGDSGPWTSDREAECLLALQLALRLERRNDIEALAIRLYRESASRSRGVALVVASLAQAFVMPDAAARHTIVTSALELAARRGYVRPILDCGPPIARLLAAALARPLPGFVRDFVRRKLETEDDRTTPGSDDALTDRELDVLFRVAQGATNGEIARDLFVSVNTVKTHLKHLFAKLGVSTRTEAAHAALLSGLLDVEN